MSSIKVGLLIWCKMIIITAFLFAGITMFSSMKEALMGLVIILFGGMIATCPLPLFIFAFLAWSEKLPYNNQGRMAWVTFCLIALIIGVFALFTRRTFHHEFICRLIGITIAGLVLAVLLTRNSLNKFYNSNHEI